MDLAEKVIVLQGGFDDFGLLFLGRLLSLGGTVVVIVKSYDESLLIHRHTADVRNGHINVELCDPLNEGDMSDLIEAIIEQFGQIDLAFYNFQQLQASRFLTELTYPEWQQTIDLTMNHFFIFSRSILPHMQDQRAGFFLSLSNTDNIETRPYSSSFNIASKAMLEMVRAFSREVKQQGVQYHHLFVNNLDTVPRRRHVSHRQLADHIVEMYDHNSTESPLFSYLIGKEVHLEAYND